MHGEQAGREEGTGQEDKAQTPLNIGEDWYEESPTNDITIGELRKLCERYREARTEKTQKDSESKAIGVEISILEQKILEQLNEHGMKNFTGDFGMVIRSNQVSVKQPSTDSSKRLFYDYLKSVGAYDGLISINSRTLTSWVRKEIDASKNPEWVPPGLEKPEKFETISLRKG